MNVMLRGVGVGGGWGGECGGGWGGVGVVSVQRDGCGRVSVVRTVSKFYRSQKDTLGSSDTVSIATKASPI